MTDKKKLQAQIEAMKTHYLHSMSIYHAILSEKFQDIDAEKIYTASEMKDFFANHGELYEAGWLNGYLDGIDVLENFLNKL